MGKSDYKKVSGGNPAFIKGWLEELPFICVPKGCKRFYKKALNKFERQRGKRSANEE